MLVSLLNPILLATLGAGFLALRSFDRRLDCCGWWAAAFFCGAGGFLLDVGRPHLPAFLVSLVSNALFLAAALTLVVGFARRYGQPVPVLGMTAVAGGSTAILLWFLVVSPDIVVRAVAINVGAGLLFGQAAFIAWRAGRPGTVERAVTVATTVTSLSFFVRTALSLWREMDVLTPENYFESGFLASLRLGIAVQAPVLALVLLTAVGRDLLGGIREEAVTDELTGVANRRGFFERAAMLLERPRADGAVALIAVDIDHFKQVNDNHGHAVGDRVLARVSGVLVAGLDPSAVVGRIGGEEFAIVVPVRDDRAAVALAESLRKAVSGSRCPGSPPVTASFGVATASPGERLERVLARADTALYCAKLSGRDRVEAVAIEARSGDASIPVAAAPLAAAA